MANNLHTIDPVQLSGISGGDNKPPPPPDFTSRYVQVLKDDWNGAQNRANRATAAGNQHEYGEAAKQWAAAAFDDAGLITDAIAPFRAIF